MDMPSPVLFPTPERIATLDRLGDEIAELAAHLEAATARLLALIREFDARGGWHSGFRSCATWLSWRVGLDLGAAREKVRVARALGSLPLLSEALARGELSYAKVRAITRVATPATEARLLGVGRAGTAAHVERIVRGWRRVDRQAEAREAARRHASRALHVSHDDDGMVVLRGRLEPEVGALLLRALEAARAALRQPAQEATAPAEGPSAEGGPAARRATHGPSVATSFESRLARKGPSAETHPATSGTAEGPSAETSPSAMAFTDGPSLAQQQADALVLLAETALAHGLDPGAPGERYQVVVHVDAPALADPEQPGQSVLEDGEHVAPDTARRLACDASRVVMRHDAAGRLREIGARTRTISPALRRALQSRDRGCRFPGCGLRLTQGHHLRHWAEGGPTTLSNLALLCRLHHRAVHEAGYQVERLHDGTLRFLRPDGRRLPDVPPTAPVPADPVAMLRARHEAQELRVHARTACPTWVGERLDLGWALDVLHPLANPLTPVPSTTPPPIGTWPRSGAPSAGAGSR